MSQRILVGDDRIDFAKEAFPTVPNAEVDFVRSPEAFIREAQKNEYDILITDLNYTDNGREGFTVLEETKDIPARRVLWTGDAYKSDVQDRANKLEADVLDKSELATIVGQSVNDAPLKEDGKVFVYTGKSDSIEQALRQTAQLPFDEDKVTVGSDLEQELKTEEYGLVIDTTPMRTGSAGNGEVAHDMKYLHLDTVPRVREIDQVMTSVLDIYSMASNYLNE